MATDDSTFGDRTYDAQDITVLEGLEAVRKRPGMYIGSTGLRGLHHLVWEVVDNSVDEALAGQCSTVDITVHPDNSVTVRDDGRGIPVDTMEKEGKSAVEVVLTVLHAGGKFGDGGGYKVSGGLHGVGVSVVNALSETLHVEVLRDGFTWSQDYERGQSQNALTKGEPTDEHGTQITFMPDADIFEVIDFDFEILETRLRETAFLTRGLRIRLRDERDDGKEIEFRYEGGIEDFVAHLNANKDTLGNKIVFFEGESDEGSVEVAMQWNSTYQESIFSFANNINTHEGGSHMSGFRAALTRTINAYARKTGELKERDDNLSGEDIREGLTAVISAKLQDPQFEGQTKTKLGNPGVEGFVASIVNACLSEFLEENPRESRAIIRKAVSAAQARAAARNARDLTRRKSALEHSTLPGKLADCSVKDPSLTEIFVVEGDSAGGSAKQGRDRSTQAVLPLRGKILNVEKSRIDKVLQNVEIQALITAMGTGIRDDFDIERARYHKLILMSVDAEEHVFVRDGRGRIRMTQIGSFIDAEVDGLPAGEQGLVRKVREPLGEVLSVGLNDRRVKFNTVKGVIRHDVDEPLYEVTTAYGRSVRVTASHSIYVYEDGKLKTKRGDEIAVGDLVAAPRKIDLPGDGPARIDLLRELHPHAGVAEQIWVRGPAVQQFNRERILAEHSGSEQLVQPRVDVPEDVRLELAARRRACGISQRDLCSQVGIRQPVTFYGWEKGTSRPILPHFEAYVRAVGGDVDTVRGRVTIGDSAIERTWTRQYRAARKNRLRDEMRLSELSEGDLDWFEDREDVWLTPEHYAREAVPRFIAVTPQLMTLLGFFTAEGNVTDRGGIRLAIGNGNIRYATEMIAALQSVFGLAPRAYDGDATHPGEVKVVNRIAALAWGRIFGFHGCSSATKRIPDLVWNVSEDLRMCFLRGFLLGDGTVHDRGFSLYTSSRDLASGFVYLLQSLGVMASTSRALGGTPTGVLHGRPLRLLHDHWRISVAGADALRSLEAAWRDHPNGPQLTAGLQDRRQGTPEWRWLSDDLVALPVRKVRKVESSTGCVYDFSVFGDQSFIAGNGGLHCHNTDADVDGAHIRTLILTLLFREMPELIEQGYVYIAKPPLYRLKQGSREQYIEKESELEDVLLSDKLERMVVTDRHNTQLRLTEARWARFTKLLHQYEGWSSALRAEHGSEAVEFLEDSGLLREQVTDIEGALALLERDVVEGAPHVTTLLSREDGRIVVRGVEERTGLARTHRLAKALFESQEYRQFVRVHAALTDLAGSPPFTVAFKDAREEADDFGDLRRAVMKVAQKGITPPQRFKGLGEMNADQLRETTMDPATRTLARVTIEDAAQADLIFSMLMGDQVEPRRLFIEDNARKVANLDV